MGNWLAVQSADNQSLLDFPVIPCFECRNRDFSNIVKPKNQASVARIRHISAISGMFLGDCRRRKTGNFPKR